MSETPKFSFGAQNGSSASTSSSLFGTSNNTGGGLFGGGGSGTGFSFGNVGKAPEASKPEGQKALFGATPSGTASNIFGQQAGQFGSNQKADENKSTAGTPSLFSSFGNTVQTPAKTAAPTGSGMGQTTGLFGASTGGAPLFSATTSTPNGSFTPGSVTAAPPSIFGGLSTTPAGPPPSSSAFGASTGGGGGIFGNVGASLGQQKLDGSLFTQKPAAQNQPVPTLSGTNGKPATTSNLFAPPQPAGGAFFANKGPENNSTTFTGFSNFSNQPATSGATVTSTAGTSEAPKLAFSLGQGSSASNSFTSGAPSSTKEPVWGPPPAGAPTPNFNFRNATSASSATPGSAAPISSTDTGAPKQFFSFPASSAATQPTPTDSTAAPSAVSRFNIPTPASSGPTTTGTHGTTGATQAATPSLFTPSTTSGQATSISFPTLGNTTSGAASQPAAANSGTAPIGPAPTVTQSGRPGFGGSTLGASTAGPVPPTQSRLRNKTMDEILTRWASDLTKYTKEFKTQAETVARWDQILVDNMNKITKLYTQTALSEKETASVEMQLTMVENQQNELDSWLTKYETEVDEMLAKNGPAQTEVGGPDQERERTYKLAEKLGERLEDMSRDLESMIEEVNSANASLNKNSKADEPITQIVRILNSHLTQLQAIDQGTVVLQAKVVEAQKNATTLGGYLNNGNNGAGGANVDDFYRSYLGRR